MTHYLVWQQFRMACGRKPDEVSASASFWMYVDCPECLAAVDRDPTSPLYIDLTGGTRARLKGPRS